MAMTSMAPAKTASKAKWAAFLTDQDIDVPAGASRADLIALWALNLDDETDVEEMTPTEAQYLASRPAPSQAAATVDVPDELTFSTDTGERRDPEKLLIKIDGQAHYLYEPSFSMLLLIGSNLASVETPFEDRIRTMMDLINTCLDDTGVRAVRAAMFSRDNRFDQDILGHLTATIFQKWAPNEKIVTDSQPAGNRAARRRR